MKKNILTAALMLCLAAVAARAEDQPLKIYGPPRSGVQNMSKRVTRTKHPAALIELHWDRDLIREISNEEFEQWLQNNPFSSMNTVGQTPTAAPAGPGDKDFRLDGDSIVMQ